MPEDGVPGAPVTELEYKHVWMHAVLEEAKDGDIFAKEGWYHEVNLVPGSAVLGVGFFYC